MQQFKRLNSSGSRTVAEIVALPARAGVRRLAIHLRPCGHRSGRGLWAFFGQVLASDS